MPLRPLSPRPGVVVSDHAARIVDPATGAVLGRPGPFGRERVVNALPIGDALPLYDQGRAVHDQNGYYLIDPDGNLVGRGGVWICRVVYAAKTEDTRRL